jgi:hypothetical protein
MIIPEKVINYGLCISLIPCKEKKKAINCLQNDRFFASNFCMAGARFVLHLWVESKNPDSDFSVSGFWISGF